MARRLRALQAAGQGVAAWPNEVVTRLAHLDAVTARYLICPDANQDVESALDALRTIERWVHQQLTPGERAEVRRFEIMIRVEDRELEAPLLLPDHAPEDQMTGVSVADGVSIPRSLRAGLRALDDDDLTRICRRLGLRPLDIERADRARLARVHQERAVADTLRDDHLLSILVATLDRETQELLAALVRGLLDLGTRESLAEQPAVSNVAGGRPWTLRTPAVTLRGCGLAYRSGDPVARLWVPVELQRRLDGVLRAFGV
jgi:hypothetical protein